MTREKSKPKSLAELAESLPRLIAELTMIQQDIADRMDKLKKQGLIYANEHWRDKKYLYLLYPMQSGEARRREYVGKDPDKIKSAQDAIERAKAFDALEKQFEHLESIGFNSRMKLQDAIKMLTSW